MKLSPAATASVAGVVTTIASFYGMSYILLEWSSSASAWIAAPTCILAVLWTAAVGATTMLLIGEALKNDKSQ